jgi:hypothetical protein
MDLKGYRMRRLACRLICSFIKTTYDISLDSQISLLPLGFSLTSAVVRVRSAAAQLERYEEWITLKIG